MFLKVFFKKLTQLPFYGQDMLLKIFSKGMERNMEEDREHKEGQTQSSIE